ncbi:hypothetical protein EON65_19030, partial [archaeon]
LQGSALAVDTAGSLVIAGGDTTVATLGLKDVVVVAVDGAVLVSARDRVQDVGAVVKALKETGDSNADLGSVVHRPWGSYQTTDRWLQVLEASVQVNGGKEGGGLTWLHALHLGIAYTERGFISEPTEYFTTSTTLKPNPIAERCLAVLQTTPQAAWPHYQNAWAILHRDFTGDADAYSRLTLNLITEISFFLQQNLWYDEMETFINDVLSHNYMSSYEVDAFLTMQIKFLMHTQQYATAQDLLSSHCFPTYAKARDDLMSMWNQASEGIAAQKKGTALTPVERHQARMQNRIPDNIGCQYASEVSWRVYVLME